MELLAGIRGDMFGSIESLRKELHSSSHSADENTRFFLLQRVYQVETDIHGRRCCPEDHNKEDPPAERRGKETEGFQQQQASPEGSSSLVPDCLFSTKFM